jgi:hypothetical protein
MKKGMRERHTLFQNLNWLPNYCALDLTLLTCDNPTLPYEQNEIIFKHVFEYIKRSERRSFPLNTISERRLTFCIN